MLSRFAKIVFFGAAACIVVGCGDGVQPNQQETVYFTSVETDSPAPETVPDPGPDVPADKKEAYQPIVDGFVKNHKRLLARTDIKTQIGHIEDIFVALGKYLQLVSFYRQDWKEKGPSSHVADRYAWALVRLGDRKQARAVLDKLLAADPNNALYWFVDGAYYLQKADRTPDDIRHVVDAWKKTVKIDPKFNGFEGINADMVNNEIGKFERELDSVSPKSGPELAVQSAAEIVHRAVTAAPKVPPEQQGPSTNNAPAVAVENTAAQTNNAPATNNAVAVATNGATAAQPVVQKAGPRPKAERYRLLVARGQIALNEGDFKNAETYFIQAQTIEPNGFDALFGHLQTGWGNPKVRNEVATKMRKLAKRTDLTPQQQIDLGIFLWTKMTRKDLAGELFKKAKKADPSVASRVDGLLKTMNAK